VFGGARRGLAVHGPVRSGPVRSGQAGRGGVWRGEDSICRSNGRQVAFEESWRVPARFGDAW
jgi:hypothetical protein